MFTFLSCVFLKIGLRIYLARLQHPYQMSVFQRLIAYISVSPLIFFISRRLRKFPIRYVQLTLFTYVSDPRVQTWPLMSSPLSPLIILTIYFTVIYKILPKYMENRKPFDLRKFLIVYNAFQIISCCVIIYGVSIASTAITNSFPFEGRKRSLA